MATQYGHYINDTQITNFDAETDAAKLVIIERVEAQMERICHDYFRPVDFDIRMNGNGLNKLFLGVEPDIIYVGNVDILDIALDSGFWAWDKESVHVDQAGSSGTSVELRMLLGESSSGLFPVGINNIRIRGEYGLPERLDYDNSSGDFTRLETITGGTSGATATIVEVFPTCFLIANRSTTDFSTDEELTGGTSEETADVDNASGQVTNPPDDIIQALIIMGEYEVNGTLYTYYQEGTEAEGAYSYTGKTIPLTHIREADILLRRYINEKPMMGVV